MGLFESRCGLSRLYRQEIIQSTMPTETIPRISKRTLDQLPVQGKKVLVRVDYNVPLSPEGKVTDDTRVRETLPTLEYLLNKGAAVILCAHLGRPKGKPVAQYSLKPAAACLESLIHKSIQMAPDCVGPAVQAIAKNLKPGQILLLENLRFHPEEEANDSAFAKSLASLADYFVQDAFGAVHRAHASTTGVPELLPSAAGLLLAKEIYFLSHAIQNPQRPFVAILGGAKVSDKIEVIESLIEKVDTLLVGGAMAYTFAKAQGISVGKSRVENDKIDLALSLLEKAKKRGIQFLLPIDRVIVQNVDPNAKAEITPSTTIPEGWEGVDIGPKTVQLFQKQLLNAKTIVWNGPMGIFEMPAFAKGTFAIAEFVAEATKKGATTIVGGGDSVAAVKQAGLGNQLSHVSTGGGASLEYLEGKDLPGIAALPNV